MTHFAIREKTIRDPQYLHFAGTGGRVEHYIYFTAPGNMSFAEQHAHIERQYAAAQRDLNLAPESAIFRRIHLSDVLNQAKLVRESTLGDGSPENPVPVSIIQQAPLGGGKIAMLAYHVSGGDAIRKTRLSRRHVLAEFGNNRHLWSTRLCAGADLPGGDSAEQTRTIFSDLISTIEAQGGTLADHCVRTWLYMKDVDIFYKGMVDARRDLFVKEGLRKDTHYIASTGIEGACAHQFDLVAMDAYTNLDLVPGQIQYLNDFDKLCPTIDYNVTFERGTRLAYADRAHHYISGTASIDNAGNVLHLGNVGRQFDRAMENVDCLLRSGGASAGDMSHFIVYLRDPADHDNVAERLAADFPDIPSLIVQGSVCRPQWLVEVEGIAITKHNAPELPAF